MNKTEIFKKGDSVLYTENQTLDSIFSKGMRNLNQLTTEEIQFVIMCIQSHDVEHNQSGKDDTIIESIIYKLNH